MCRTTVTVEIILTLGPFQSRHGPSTMTLPLLYKSLHLRSSWATPPSGEKNERSTTYPQLTSHTIRMHGRTHFGQRKASWSGSHLSSANSSVLNESIQGLHMVTSDTQIHESANAVMRTALLEKRPRAPQLLNKIMKLR
mmetsp:Transcript_15087/g.41729  ORF Transcript_15087/g.41729 Transcript_15087/m.41729 type:complete len:139 (-) Transcript_15087:1856-2272(-)